MTDVFRFYAEGSIHEGGGKYYQVIRISKESNRGNSVVVTHWGKMHPGAPREPKNHGQNKIDCVSGGVVGAFNGHVRAKQKRGYNDWSVKIDLTCEKEMIIKAIESWFNRTDAAIIIAHLTHSADEECDAEVNYVEPEVRTPEPTPIVAPKHEAWGSW